MLRGDGGATRHFLLIRKNQTNNRNLSQGDRRRRGGYRGREEEYITNKKIKKHSSQSALFIKGAEEVNSSI